ncbi:MAG: hypothetical protein WCT49_05135, partial [Candidatus Paceibacterota bacterium]
GNYKNITLQKDSTLTLSGGTYNLNILDLKEHSTLIFTAPTTLNIQFKLRGRDAVSILNGANVKPTDLHINYIGIRNEQKSNKTMEQDDEDEVMAFLDKQEKADCKNQKIGRPILFGKNSFLNFTLIAPKANVNIERDSTLRGQMLARKIRVRNGVSLSKNEFFSKNADPKKVVGDTGARFIVNEVVIRLTAEASLGDIQQVVGTVNGKITGFLDILGMVKIEIPAKTVAELNLSVDKLKALHSPYIQDVMINFVYN